MVAPMTILDVVESSPCEVEVEADDVTVGSVADSVLVEVGRVDAFGVARNIRSYDDIA